MVKKKKPEVENLDEIVNQCLIVADRKGKILGKDSTPVTSWLAMEYQSDYGKIRFDVRVSAMGNGSYFVEVKDGKKTLFRARGNYTSAPYNSRAEKYVSGEWENNLEREYEKVK